MNLTRKASSSLWLKGFAV